MTFGKVNRMDKTEDTFAALGQFNKTLVYERRGTPAAVQNELVIIAEFDKEAERQSKKWGTRVGFSVLAAIVGAIVMFMGFSNGNSAGGVLGVITLLTGVGLGIYCGVHWSRWSHRNIEDRRYVILQQLIHHLSCDMASDAQVDVALNGNDYHKPAYLAPADGTTSIASGESAYRLPWLSLSGQFVDGHRFCVTATQLVKRKERRKRKYVKVKEAIRERIDLEVRCKPQKYARWNDLPIVLKNQKLALPLDAWDLRITGERVTLTGLMPRAVKVTGRGSSGSLDPGLLDSGAVLGLFALLYRALSEVRK